MSRRAYRRYQREVKADRRLKEDRAQHGNDRSCACFSDDGRTRSFFADTPTICSRWCCGNPRRHFGLRTMQELRGPTVADWV